MGEKRQKRLAILSCRMAFGSEAVKSYLIVLILLGHCFFFGLSLAFVPVILEPNLHLWNWMELQLIVFCLTHLSYFYIQFFYYWNKQIRQRHFEWWRLTNWPFILSSSRWTLQCFYITFYTTCTGKGIATVFTCGWPWKICASFGVSHSARRQHICSAAHFKCESVRGQCGPLQVSRACRIYAFTQRARYTRDACALHTRSRTHLKHTHTHKHSHLLYTYVVHVHILKRCSGAIVFACLWTRAWLEEHFRCWKSRM